MYPNTKYVELPADTDPRDMLAEEAAKGWQPALTVPIPVIVDGAPFSRYWLIRKTPA